MSNFSRVQKFYAHPPEISSVVRVARKLDFPTARSKEVAAILRAQNIAFGASPSALENLDALEKGAVAIVSGQQVGLFSGPAYSFYKALTAIQIAADLRRSGIPAVPIFWMATEDHDVDEVRHVSWFQDGDLKRFELSPPDATEAGLPVGKILLGPRIEEQAHQAADLLSKQGSVLLARLLKETYRGKETYGSAFAKLFARLFASQGLILLDPLDPALHRLAAPIYQRAIEDRDVLNEKLLQRGKDLDAAGFAAQVKVTAKSTLLFYMGGQVNDGHAPRQVITAGNGGKFQAGQYSWTKADLLGAIQSNPQAFSPSALFRAVVQDYLLPTAAYIGGAAEISYFAQSQVVYEHLLGRMPVILPRPGFTLVDAKAGKLLRMYKLKVEDIWAGSQEVRRQHGARFRSNELRSRF